MLVNEITLWDCANGATFLVQDTGEQTGRWNVGRCQRDTNGRWSYGTAWHQPNDLTPRLALPDLTDYAPVLAEMLTEAGVCRH